MKVYGRIALAAGAAAFGETAAFGHPVCYQVDPGPSGTNGFIQQNGNNAYEYGDDVHVGSGMQVHNVTIDFTLFSYDAATYTPQLQVDLYAVDSNGVPIDSNLSDTIPYTPLATEFRSDVTFTGSNYNNGGTVRGVEQSVTFDFSSDGVVAADFAFAYRDNNPAGTQSPGYNFSVFVSSANPSVGTGVGPINPAYLDASVNDPITHVFSKAIGFNVQAQITCDAVPEPGMLSIAALGGLAALRRRRA